MAVDIYNFSELLSFIITLSIILFLLFKISDFFEISNREVLIIYFWHTLFATVFMVIDLNHGHDASGWFTNGSSAYQGGYYGNDFHVLFEWNIVKKFFSLLYCTKFNI